MKQKFTTGNLSDIGISDLSSRNEQFEEEKKGLIPRNNSADFNDNSFITNNFRYSVPVPNTSGFEHKISTSSQFDCRNIVDNPKPNFVHLSYSGNDLSNEKSPRGLSNLYQYLAPTYRQKAQQFRRAFIGSAVDTDHLLVDYSCALYHNGLLTQGRMYITEEWICFYAKIIHESKIMISVRDIVSITKQKTAKLIPNAIQIIHGKENERYFFTSFAAREKTFAILNKVWENFLNQQSMSVEEIIMQVRQIYGDDSVTAMMELPESPVGPVDVNKLPDSQNETDKLTDTSQTNGCLENSSFNILISPKAMTNSFLGHKKKASISTKGQERNTDSFSQSETKEELTESFNSQTSTSRVFDEIGIDMQNNLTDSVDEYLDETNTTDTDNYNFMKQLDSLNSKLKSSQKKFPNQPGGTHQSQGPTKCGSGHEHLGRQYADCEIPLNIDAVFQALFTFCKFTELSCGIRGTSDYHVDNDWNILPTESDCDSGEINRKIHYTVALKQKLGPRCCLSVETQQLLVKETIPHRRYVIDTVVVNENVPFSTCFHSECRYCLLSINKYTTHLKVSAQVIFDKQVFFGAKNIIESTFRTNIAENFNDLTELLIQQAKQLSRHDQLTGGSLVKTLDMQESAITKPLTNQSPLEISPSTTGNDKVNGQVKSGNSSNDQTDSTCSSMIISWITSLLSDSGSQFNLAWLIMILLCCVLCFCLSVMYSRFLEFESIISHWHHSLETLAKEGKCMNQLLPYQAHQDNLRKDSFKDISTKLKSLESSFKKVLSLVGELRKTVEDLEA